MGNLHTQTEAGKSEDERKDHASGYRRVGGMSASGVTGKGTEEKGGGKKEEEHECVEIA